VPPARIINLPDTANIAIVASLPVEMEEGAKNSLDSLIITSVAMSIKKNMEASPKYHSYIFPVYTVEAGENGLTKEQVLDIKESSNANYLISVEHFKSNSFKKRIRTSNENCIRIVVPHTSVIKIYDVDRLAVIDERVINDTLSLQVNADAWETETELIHRLPDDKTAVLLIVKEMAKVYVEEIVPFWKEENRYYYLDSHIERAKIYIDNEDWSKAMNIWSQYVNDENKALAAISCFNMALGCEMLGEYDLALKWIDNVKRKDEAYYWGEYKKLLDRRIAEKAILDSIMK
jgi:tetratricopeptide (TPR) repeat protein